MLILARLMSATERTAQVVGALTELAWTALAAARIILRRKARP